MFKWTKDYQKAFEETISLSTSAFIMQSLDWSLPFELMCDVSGAVLWSCFKTKKMKVSPLLFITQLEI